MTQPPSDPPTELAGAIRSSWRRFLDVYEPLRPELYRYCRHLCGSPWDADDLVQEALARAFALLGTLDGEPQNPRAWLFRVASNAWIDRVRRQRELSAEAADPDAEAGVEPEPRAAREAAGTLIEQLSPQERAAVVLKDVFELTLEETALALGTSVGAVKAALSGGRGKLAEPERPLRRAPDRAVLDAFCEAFNARDLDRLTALLLDTSSCEVVRITTQYGRDAARRTVLTGMLFGSRVMADPVRPVGVDPRHRHGILPDLPRAELREHRGELVLLSWYAHHDGEAVRAITRLDCEGTSVSRLRNYFYTPDVIADVCAELGVPFRTNGYAPYVGHECT
jgi:RNA polymerase sigma-70 factor (ECF subfamily)